MEDDNPILRVCDILGLEDKEADEWMERTAGLVGAELEEICTPHSKLDSMFRAWTSQVPDHDYGLFELGFIIGYLKAKVEDSKRELSERRN